MPGAQTHNSDVDGDRIRHPFAQPAHIRRLVFMPFAEWDDLVKKYCVRPCVSLRQHQTGIF
jgi:hypothetical protein